MSSRNTTNGRSAAFGISTPACVVCNGAMKVKEVRQHPNPAFTVVFTKCNECGLERPLVQDNGPPTG